MRRHVVLAGGVGLQIEQAEHVAGFERLVDQFPAAAADHAILGVEDGVAVFRFDGQRAAGAVRNFHQFQQVRVAQMRIRQAGNRRDPDAGFTEGIEFGAGAVRRKAAREGHAVQAGDGRRADEFEQRGGKIDRAHHLVHLAACRVAWRADDERDARAEVADRGIALSPGVVLEELHAMVGIDDDDGVVGQTAGLQVRQHLADFVVEFRHAAVVQVDDLIEIELFPGRALATDDLERIGEPGHRELGFAGIVRIREARIPGPFRGKRRMRGGVEHIEEKRLHAFRQPRHEAPGAHAQRLRERDSAEVVHLGQKQPPQPVMHEQRNEQPQILGALANEVFQVPLVFRQVGVIETEGEFPHVRAAPVRDCRGTVACLFQPHGQGIHAQPCRFVVRIVVADPVGVGPGAGQHGNQAGRRARARDVAVGEERAALAQSVDVGRQAAMVAQRAQTIGAQGVGADHENIGARVRGARRRARRARRRLPGRPDEDSRIEQGGRPQGYQGVEAVFPGQLPGGHDEQDPRQTDPQ